MALGERLDRLAGELLEMGGHMQTLGEQVDARGAEIVDRAGRVVETGSELIAVLPTLERALDMATPLEGAIDRFGRFVDRLPGGQRPAPEAPAPRRGPPCRPTSPPLPNRRISSAESRQQRQRARPQARHAADPAVAVRPPSFR